MNLVTVAANWVADVGVRLLLLLLLGSRDLCWPPYATCWVLGPLLPFLNCK
jgi:hypothetical protein